MKKLFATLLAMLMVLSLAGCAKKEEPVADNNTEEVTEPADATGVYTVYNMTGAKLTELYMYPTGAEDKGENYAEGGLADGASVEIVYEGEYGVDYILEFANADSEARNYPTLHIEEAPIKLLSVDEAAGASNISFKG